MSRERTWNAIKQYTGEKGRNQVAGLTLPTRKWAVNWLSDWVNEPEKSRV